MKVKYFVLHPDMYYRDDELGKDVRNGRDWVLRDGFLVKNGRFIPIGNVAWFDGVEETDSSRPEVGPSEAAVASQAASDPASVPAKRGPGRPPHGASAKVRSGSK